MSEGSLGRKAIVFRIRKAADTLGRAPKLPELIELTDVSRKDLRLAFPKGYSEALIVAGFVETRDMAASRRKKRGYVPPWNYIGGETKIPSHLNAQWRILSANVLSEITTCEPQEKGDHPEGPCSMKLIVNHIIPRRCGGPILDRANLDVMCHRAHKVHKPDLYWRSEEDIDLAHLQDYQLRRLAAGGLLKVQLEHAEKSILVPPMEEAGGA